MKIVIDKSKFFVLLIGFLYFAVGDVSRMLGIVRIPRELIYGLFFVLLILFAIQRIKMLELVDIIVIVLILSIVIIGTVQYGEYIESTTSRLAPLLIFFPSYIFFRLYSFDKLEYIFEKAALFSGIFLLIYYVFFVRDSGVTYNMSFAYWIAFPIVCYTGIFFRKRKAIYLIIDILMIIALFLSGCRGALILTFVCIVYLIITEAFRKGTSVKKIIIIAIIGAIILVVVYFSDAIFLYLSRFSNTSRNVRMLLNGNMLESTSRDKIHQICQQLIEQNNWGYGPLASRQLLLGHNYPHSLWYELQLDFGQIPGIVLFVLIILMTVVNLIRYHNKEENIIVAFISIVGIGSLMVSSSYLYELYVPATIALFFNWKRQYHKRIDNMVE